MHIVQLASVRDEIRILRGAVAAHEILQGQIHAGERIHLAREDGLRPADGKDGGINLVRGIGDIDLLLRAIGKGNGRPGQHQIGGKHLIRRGYVHVLERKLIVHAIETDGRFLQGRDARRQFGL